VYEKIMTDYHCKKKRMHTHVYTHEM